LGAYMGGYHWARIVVAGNPFLLVVFVLCAVLLPAMLLHFYFVFPSPKSILQRRPLTTICGIYSLPIASLVALIGSYLYVFIQARSNASPDDIKQSLWFFLNEIYVYLGIAAAWYLAGIFCLVHSYRTARDLLELNQVKWILLGTIAAAIPI